VHHRYHGTHWYNIQVLVTHASTWVHQYSSLLLWSVPLGSARSCGNGGTYWYFPPLPCDLAGTDYCSSEEYPFGQQGQVAMVGLTSMSHHCHVTSQAWIIAAVKHIDARMLMCAARTWIAYQCVPCYPWCTHPTSLVVKKKFSFLVAMNNSIKVGPLVFLL
jgi:hypothetical protein